MNRYWVSWWTGYYESEGCTKPPFQVWSSGSKEREGKSGDEISLCAVIDADSENDIVISINKHFPDNEMRFIDLVSSDYVPGDRFPGFENKTSIKE